MKGTHTPPPPQLRLYSFAWAKLKIAYNFFRTPGGHGVNTKVVDIDKIYLNMQYETDPIAQF